MQTQEEEESRNGDCKQLKALLFRMFLERSFFIKFAIPNSTKIMSQSQCEQNMCIPGTSYALWICTNVNWKGKERHIIIFCY